MTDPNTPLPTPDTDARPVADPYTKVVTPWMMDRMARYFPDSGKLEQYSLHEYSNGRYLVRYFQGSAREVTFAHPPEYYRDENGGSGIDRILEIMPDIGDALTRD